MNRPACVSVIHTMYAYPTNFGSMLGQCRSPLLVQCRQIVYDAGPTLLQYSVCCILSGSTPANTWHLPNTGFDAGWTLKQHWVIVPLLFAWTAMRMTLFSFRRQKSHYPDNTMYWPSADVTSITLGQHYTNLISLSPGHECNRKYIFS